MLSYPSVWARLMGVFSVQRTHQEPGDHPDEPDTEELLSRTAERRKKAAASDTVRHQG